FFRRSCSSPHHAAKMATIVNKDRKIEMIKVGNKQVPRFQYDPALFLNRVTTIMGDSGSGKTTIAKNIIKGLEKEISIGILVSATELSNHSFSGIFPGPCIHDDLTADILDRVIERQKNATQIFKYVNRIDVLRRLYEK